MNLKFNLLCSFSIFNVSFLIDLLKYKHISHAVIFQCNKNENLNNVHKIFNQHSVLVAMYDINENLEIRKSYGKIGIIINSSCKKWTSALNTTSVETTNSWIIMTDNLSETTGSLANYPVEVDSDITVAHRKNNLLDLYEVFNTGSRYKGAYIVRNIGFWNSSLNIVLKDRRDLQGAKIKMSLVSLRADKVVNETLEHYMEHKAVKVDTVHRFKYFIILKYLRDMYNISYHIQRVESWGYVRNGSFDGMVGALSRGDAEIGGSAIFSRADRAQHLQYVSEVWHSSNLFIFRHPKYPGGFYTIYTRPLSNVVWYCLVSAVVVTAFVLWMTLKIKAAHDSTLSLAALTIWGAFCQQGSSVNHHASSVKLVLFTSFMCALTVYQYYNATIVSSLLQEAPKNIRTLKDLLHSDLQVGVDDVLYNRDYFKNTKDPVAIELYKKKIAISANGNFFSSDVGMALVKKGGFAFHLDMLSAFPIIKDTFTKREICEISTVPLYPLQKTGVAVKRFSPYKEHLAYGIRRLYEAGLPSRLHSVVDTAMSECVHTPDTSIFRVNVREFSMPLTALACGAFAAVVVFSCELLVDRILQRNTIEFRH